MRWMWIDRVLEIVPRQRLVAVKRFSADEEYVPQHFPGQPVMPACFILEGMAQTGGVLVGHAEGFKYNVVLAKIGKAELTREAVPGDTLRYTASVERMDDAGCSVVGIVELLPGSDEKRSWAPIGRIEMMFSHLDNNQGGGGQAGVDFPEGNFVFGDSFKELLARSGY